MSQCGWSTFGPLYSAVYLITSHTVIPTKSNIAMEDANTLSMISVMI